MFIFTGTSLNSSVPDEVTIGCAFQTILVFFHIMYTQCIKSQSEMIFKWERGRREKTILIIC